MILRYNFFFDLSVGIRDRIYNSMFKVNEDFKKGNLFKECL